MIRMIPNQKQELVRFEQDGIQYEMTRDAMLAAWKQVEHENKVADAAQQLEALCFGWGTVGLPHNDAEAEESRIDFEEEYGISYDETAKRAELIAAQYDCSYDSELTDDEMWLKAIKRAINDLKDTERNSL